MHRIGIDFAVWEKVLKVVLFCGGFGLRFREYQQSLPKPLMLIGERPILWHIMKYYAHYGHTDFILCLGWKGQTIKDYFLKSNGKAGDALLESNNKNGAEHIRYDEEGWDITFVNTGTDACIGQRLKAVQPCLKRDEIFLANYADGLTNLPLPDLIGRFVESNAVGMFVSVPPTYLSLHSVASREDGTVDCIEPIVESNVWMNGGFFTFRQDIFDYIRDGEDLVEEPFERLIAVSKLRTLKFDGFWACMDTHKEKQMLEDMHAGGSAPWAVWNGGRSITSGPGKAGTGSFDESTATTTAVEQGEP